ncbi:transporter [Salipiger sp. IMCC34102]|uniref:TolC family outer membrane protein n=1 Tax=Salipiger sp. IMCC34102 TaxID=2510647 RepID=UPI00101C14C0|nr:TolC family outer membrane protein [Salipiger sp. IMCC34102]RYH02232.1 transporter [Salipiger sp. IMCC34102]
MSRFAKAALTALCLTVSVTSAHADNLVQTLTDAYAYSGLLVQNRAVLRAADEDVAQAVSQLLPVISWSSSINTQSPRAPGADRFTGSLSLTGQLNLYDGGANRYAVAAQKELVLGTRQALRSAEQQVLFRAVQAYMAIISAQEFIRLRENNVSLLQQELGAANDRFEVGEVTRTDVALAQARLAESRSLLVQARGDLEQAEAEFEAAVGREPGSISSAQPAPVSNTEAQAIAVAMRNHPDILQAQFNVAASELSIARAETSYKPQANLNAQIGTDFNGDIGNSVGLSFGGPIYSGGQIASAVRQAVAQRDQSRAGLRITTLAVRQQVANAYAVLQVARAQLSSSAEQVRAARLAFEGIREEATLGARTTLDVLNAEQDLLDARALVIQAQVAEVNASYAVLVAMGLMTAEHLRLPVQIYDPSAYYDLVEDAPPALSRQGQALDRVLSAIGQ